MKKHLLWSFLFLFMVFSIQVFGQNVRVKGTVSDANNRQTLPGVSILLKGTTTGTTTGLNGHYSILVPKKGILVFSYVGYKPREAAIGNQKIIDVALSPQSVGLNELVVVGYGVQKRLTLTGSISTLKGKKVSEVPVANISNSIAGKLAGVSMRPNGGQPGHNSPAIYIRGIATTGNNQPLIVVDGIIRNNLSEIDPNTIASITVLKDAAAVAPYGLGGANGVILITTKTGKIGTSTLSFSTYYGLQRPIHNYYSKLLNAKQFMSLSNDAYLNDNPNSKQLPFAQDLIDNYDKLHAQYPDKYPESNPQEYTKTKVPIQTYDLQLSGGTDKIKYYVELGLFKQNGMFTPVNYRRYNYNITLDAKVTKTTSVNVTLIGAREQNNSVDAGANAVHIFRSGFKFIPIRSIYYSNGLWGQSEGNSPVGILKSGGYSDTTSNTLLTTISIEQQLPFIKGLSVKGVFSYDPTQQIIKNWHRPFYYYVIDTSTSPYTYTKNISESEGGAKPYTWLSQTSSQSQYFTYQAYLNYHNTFGKNNITGLVVAEARNNIYQYFMARRDHFAVNIDELSMGSSNKVDFNNAGSSTTMSQMSLVYRFSYNFADKYLFEAAGRYDGHSYFAPGKRWGYFPAFSVGWVLSEENFIKNNFSFIDNLKIRASWGKSGNIASSAFQYLSGYNLYGNAYAFGNGTMVQGSYVPFEANPNITWEISTKTDIGFDATLWNGLLSIDADYFHERRSGMLLPPAISVPIEYGLPLADENQGIMENHGMELTVGSNHKFKNGLQIGFNGNISYAKNKLVQVFETPATYNNPNRRRTGRALGTKFGYHALGLFTTADDKNGDGVINSADGYNVIQFGVLHPGDIKYADISGPNGVPDGKIDSYDKIAIGKPNYPAMTYGFTTTASWKRFDMSLFFQGSALSSLDINLTFQTAAFENNGSNTTREYYNNMWTPTHQNAKYPRPDMSPPANNTQTSDFWIVNTGFIRLKTVILGYTIPKNVTQFLRIQHARVYFSGQNILTFSKLKFMDPEVGYTDRENAYPNQKIYTLGLDVTF